MDHQAACTFGTGFYRLELRDGTVRFCQDTPEVERVYALLPRESVARVLRDGYCLDGLRGDANTPDVVDGEHWLSLPRVEAMRELGLTDEAVYARVYRDVEDAVGRRNNRESQTGVHASIVIKRPGAAVVDA